MNKRRRNRMKEGASSAGSAKVGWRPLEWAAAVGLCRATVYNLLADGSIDSVKVGTARVIITNPADFLSNLANEAA